MSADGRYVIGILGTLLFISIPAIAWSMGSRSGSWIQAPTWERAQYQASSLNCLSGRRRMAGAHAVKYRLIFMRLRADGTVIISCRCSEVD
jgi:hypothetical protein